MRKGQKKKKKQSRESVPEEAQLLDLLDKEFKTNYYYKTFLKRWEYQITLPVSWETRMQVKKQQSEPDMEQWPGSKLGKEYVKAVLLSPCLFNLYADYIMRNARLDKAQAGTKIARRNINNLKYNDTPVMAESKEELKSLLMKVKKSEKAGLKLNI